MVVAGVEMFSKIVARNIIGVAGLAPLGVEIVDDAGVTYCRCEFISFEQLVVHSTRSRNSMVEIPAFIASINQRHRDQPNAREGPCSYVLFSSMMRPTLRHSARPYIAIWRNHQETDFAKSFGPAANWGHGRR